MVRDWAPCRRTVIGMKGVTMLSVMPKLRLLRCRGNHRRIRKAAAIEFDVTLMVQSADGARHWRAVHASDQAHVAPALRSPTPRPRKEFPLAVYRCRNGRPHGYRRKHVREMPLLLRRRVARAVPAWRYRVPSSGGSSACSRSRLPRRAADRRGDDLTACCRSRRAGRPARAPGCRRWRRAARENAEVVPQGDDLAGVGLAPREKAQRDWAQSKCCRSHGNAGPKAISMRVPTGNLTALTLMTVVAPSRSGRSSMRRLRVMTVRVPPLTRTALATTRRPLPRAPRCGSRSSLVETIGRAMLNSRAIFFRRAVDAAAVVLDEVAAIGQLADVDVGVGIEAVVGQLLQHQPGAACPSATPAFCFKPLDGAEARSSPRARISNSERPLSWPNSRPDFELSAMSRGFRLESTAAMPWAAVTCTARGRVSVGEVLSVNSVILKIGWPSERHIKIGPLGASLRSRRTCVPLRGYFKLVPFSGLLGLYRLLMV